MRTPQMRVVVDTSVWALAFRRRAPVESTHAGLLKDLIQVGRVVLLGLVRQELLSGIRHLQQYDRLRRQLRAFPEAPLDIADHEVAAEYFYTCMATGVHGSAADYLICAYATRRNFHILTADPDCRHYSKHIPLSLFKPLPACDTSCRFLGL